MNKSSIAIATSLALAAGMTLSAQGAIVDDFNNGSVTTINGESPATWLVSGSGSSSESGGSVHLSASSGSGTWQPWYYLRSAQRDADLNFFKSSVTVSATGIAIGGTASGVAANRFSYFSLTSTTGDPNSPCGMIDLQMRGNGNVFFGWGVTTSSYHNPLNTGFNFNLGTEANPITGFTLILNPVIDSTSGLLKIAYAASFTYAGSNSLDTNGDSILSNLDASLATLSGFISTTDTAALLARWQSDNSTTDIAALQSQLAIAIQRKSGEANTTASLDVGSISATSVPEGASLFTLIPAALLLASRKRNP